MGSTKMGQHSDLVPVPTLPVIAASVVALRNRVHTESGFERFVRDRLQLPFFHGETL
jgi:hypothetical protein